VSYFLAFAGFAALIILHELGHFAAAKAVGMRVERFSLFFGPMLLKFRRGETEYGIGPIPLGGYVKITGMNPHEELTPEVAPRAYFRQPPWKRIVVILAGPAVNVLIAFLLLWGLALANGYPDRNAVAVGSVQAHQPAAGVLAPNDRIVSVDGVTKVDNFPTQISSHRCAGAPVAGCQATTPVHMKVIRGGHPLTLSILPRFDATPMVMRTRLGFAFGNYYHPTGPVSAAGHSVSDMWRVTTGTVSVVGRLFYSSQARKQVHGVVGNYEYTRQAINLSATAALSILALISLSLAIINLFPFLPLDGGHVFWAVAEKLRGRAIPFALMERTGAVGFVLVIFVALIGLTNDIHSLNHGGLNLR